MIDFIKVSTKNFNYHKLLNNGKFDFIREFNDRTGEIVKNTFGTYKRKAFYNDLYIEIIENDRRSQPILYVYGSLHKFYNNGEHNYDDFKMHQITEAINTLSELLFAKPEYLKISNIEIGINMRLFFNPSFILQGLLSHRNSRFKSIMIKGGEYFIAQHNNYYVKVYDKGLQYRNRGFELKDEILRIELKYVKMNDIIQNLRKNEYDISELTLDQLKKSKILKILGNFLYQKWVEILFYDYTVDYKALSENENRLLNNYQNINNWENYSKQQKFKEKYKFNEIKDKASMKMQKHISIFIKETMDYLTFPRKGTF